MNVYSLVINKMKFCFKIVFVILLLMLFILIIFKIVRIWNYKDVDKLYFDMYNCFCVKIIFIY